MRPRGWGGGIAGDEDLRSQDLSNEWDQNSLCVGPPLDAVPWTNYGKRFATRNRVLPQLACTHARLSVVLGIPNHALGEHCQDPESTAANSFLREIKLWYIMSALLHSRDGRIKRRQRFVLV